MWFLATRQSYQYNFGIATPHCFTRKERPFQGRILDGTGCVRLADLNGIYYLDYVFDSKNRSLSLSK